MDDVLNFRNAMASNGTEYTPIEAEKVMDAVFEFRAQMDKKFIEDPEYFDNLRNLTFAEKQQLCRDFAEIGQEVTPNEIDGLIDLILYTQE